MMNRLSEYINSKDLEIHYNNNRINIINLDELVLLTDNKIVILKDKKIINIKGNNLILLKLLDNEVLIGGNIKNIDIGD